MAVLWGSALFSAAVDNIPYVAAMNPLIVDRPVTSFADYRLCTCPSTGYTAALVGPGVGRLFRGNGTVIGASANVVIVDIARKAGHPITFWDFFRVGFPIMLGTILLSSLYLWILFLR